MNRKWFLLLSIYTALAGVILLLCTASAAAARAEQPRSSLEAVSRDTVAQARFDTFFPAIYASSAGYPVERAALTSLYDSTNGRHWLNRSGWGTTDSYCSWYGVFCDSHDHVFKLDLDGNGLTGTLPNTIGQLKYLRDLSLVGTELCVKGWCFPRKLNGAIPPEIGNLVNLQQLDLNMNQLSNPLPPEIGDLVNLGFLNLSNNQFSGSIPTEIGNLINLYSFSLDHNEFSDAIPEEFGNLVHLGYLNLGANRLSGQIPAKLSSMSNLEFLYLNENEDLTCWQTQEALNWALSLPQYSGPTQACGAFLPLVGSNDENQ